MTAFLLVGGGLALLFVGGEMLVRGAVGLAHRLGVSTLLIALTVVALGTSAPELVVSIQAALDGAPDIAIGNVVGSNIANLLLILGAAAAITPFVCGPPSIRRDGIAVLAVTLLFIGLAATGRFGAWDSGLLLILLAAYVVQSYRRESHRTDAAEAHADEVVSYAAVPRALWLLALITLGGLGALVFGADILVDGAVDLARAAGVSETVIGLTLVAFGTSLPELATCVVAAYRRAPEVALGNVLGSNLFNILGVLGAVGLISDVPVPAQIIHFDGWFMLAVTALLLPFLLTGRRLGRREAAAMLLLYAGYVAVQYYGVASLLAAV